MLKRVEEHSNLTAWTLALRQAHSRGEPESIGKSKTDGYLPAE